MEIEAKYLVTGALEAATLAALDLRPFRLTSARQVRLYDRVLDTSSRSISGALYGLRIREDGSGALLTLKGPQRQSGNIVEREELEARLPAGQELDLRCWPGDILARVHALAGEQELGVIIEVALTRHTWVIERDGQAIGELALDEGRLLTGGLVEQLHEIEIELKGAGRRSDIEELGRRLCSLLPLQPSTQSKLERGLKLLERAAPQQEGSRPGDADHS